MLGMMQPDRHGWALDAEGNPELWCFIGNVLEDKYEGSATCFDYNAGNCNKLVLLGIDASTGYCTIKHDFGQVTDKGDRGSSNPKTNGWGGLEWISRDVFVICKNSEEGTAPNGHIKAFKMDDNNGSTDYSTWKIYGLNDDDTDLRDPIWSRQNLKPGYNGSQNVNNAHMGWLTGFTSVPSTTPLSLHANCVGLSGERNANIIAMTGKHPHTQAGFNGHVAIYNLKTTADSLLNGVTASGYEHSDVWNAGEVAGGSGVSAWTLIKTWNEPEKWDWGTQCNDVNAPANETWDNREGWCTIDSKGNFYYGRVSFLGGGHVGGNCNNAYRTPLQRWDYNLDVSCYWCNNSTNCCSCNNVTVWVSTMKCPVTETSFGNRRPMVYNIPATQLNGTNFRGPAVAGYGAGWVKGSSRFSLKAGEGHLLNLYNWSNGTYKGSGIPYCSLNGGPDDDAPGTYIPFDCNYDVSHDMMSDAGCCDIYGETQGLLAKAGNETGTVTISSSDAKDTIWILVCPNAYWAQPDTSAMRAGLWVVKDRDGAGDFLDVQAFFPADMNGGSSSWHTNLGLKHDASVTSTCGGETTFAAKWSVQSAGMAFRPNSYMHV